MGGRSSSIFQIEESKVTIAESMELAARLANAPDPDGRFRRKMADAKLQQAQLLVISDELDKAQGMLGEVLAIYRELDPASLATHGESHEYLNRLSFAISVAAFREDHELVVEYKSELDQFFQAAQQRFPSYQSIYYEQSEALEIYSAYCCYFGLADQLIEVAQQQKAVLDLWKSSATRSIDYYQIMVHYSSSPFFGQTDLDCVASLHHLAWPASHRGHGNILFRLGEFEKASACYEGCQANDPQDLLIQSYCRLLAQIKKVGASRAVVAEISRSDQLKILGVKRSFALAILPERQLRELEMVLASQD